MKVLVVGAGSVGLAIQRLVRENYYCEIADVEATSMVGQFDILHICFPYNEFFASNVISYIHQFQPKLTLIESTVRPRTTRNIYNLLHGNFAVVHSPVRGQHDALDEGLRIYTKFVGGFEEADVEMAKFYYESLGLRVHICQSALESEFAKLLNLSYFATQIVFFQEVERLTEEYDLRLGDIHSFFQTFTLESKGKWPRPIFRGGVIAGSCVMKGLEMLFPHDTKLFGWVFWSNQSRIRELGQKILPET